MALVNAGADPSILNEGGIPGSRGLEGEKSFAIAAWNSAGNADEVTMAMNLCEADTQGINKSSFVSVGLKLKKNLGTAWTPVHHDRFKMILSKL
jgi:hypothetical protein